MGSGTGKPHREKKTEIIIAAGGGDAGQMLSDAVIHEGMIATTVTFARARALINRHVFDLMILDAVVRAEDALRLCRQIRAVSTIPIIAVVAQGREDIILAAFESGADDCVSSPFGTREMIARIRSVLRRASHDRAVHSLPKAFRFNRWRLDSWQRTLRRPDGTVVDVTAAEFDLLVVFCQNPGRILSREELLASTHAGLAGPIERSIDVHISRLRHKIEDDPHNPTLIKTVRMGGYFFAAIVETDG
ncbi:response regulator transcription factor (plasmid) [Rhizobium ruizarguesonis]|uniref:Regulatory protein VirG n=3 Tax=Rhizobium TaxID=379 RepID=A0AAE4YWV5_9HYPH|nr:response regulator transcription factor [Rhizobium ruizarguesonis]NEH32844.1 response regulator [Rhizobium ruizarguesonis]NEI52761.1 response regulator [Rhizobium ruizarguesonis]NEJ10238.1 response regulator [Rhizobium ruizarguesonis]NEK12673.1 response regulator [Rhizobium ruizarguesonis]TAT97569.1 response regulator transcription factor [Rhizobium ruizarguesonis]